MKKRRLRWDIGSALERHQPFAALNNILNGQRFPRFALIKKSALVPNKENRARRKDKEE